MNPYLLIMLLSISINIAFFVVFPWNSLQQEDELPIPLKNDFPDALETHHILTSLPFKEKHIQALRSFIDNGAVLVVDHKDKVLLNYHGHKEFIPASTLKILTSLAALHYLGPEHRFKTEFAYDKDSNLYIKGYGDPTLTTSEINIIAQALYQKGLRKVQTIYLDNSLFADYLLVPGNENTHKAYEARNSSLAANFNTISYKHFRKNEVRGDDGTPLIPYAREILRKAQQENRKYKYFRSLQISIKEERDSLLYFGELFKHFCIQNKIQVTKGIQTKSIPQNTQIYYTHYNTQNLLAVIQQLLHFSNNFIANQLTLSLALLKSQPATLENGVEMISRFANDTLKLNINITEGSGLSYANRVTPIDMIKLLRHFRPYKHLLKFISFDKEQFESHNIVVRAKTGSLKTVDAYIGFIDTKKHGELRLTIILNQSTNNKSQVLKHLLNVLI